MLKLHGNDYIHALQEIQELTNTVINTCNIINVKIAQMQDLDNAHSINEIRTDIDDLYEEGASRETTLNP